MPLVLRPAAGVDAEALAALFSESFRLLAFLQERHTRAEDRAFIREQVLAKLEVTVAERDGRIVGFMAAAPGWIHHLYVAPDQLRTGVGSALVADAKARSEHLELWCFAQNARGRRFYERHGFIAVARTDGAGNEFRAPDIRYRWQR